jgi:hypothetical protein
MFGKQISPEQSSGMNASAIAGGQTEAQVLPFSLVKICVRIMVEVFRNPKPFAVLIHQAIDTTSLIKGLIFGLRCHRARPWMSVGDTIHF